MIEDPHESGDRSPTPDQREQELDELTRRANALHAEVLRSALALDDGHHHVADGCRSMVEWLAYRYRLPHSVARQWMKAARAFEEMPQLAEQYAAGNVSFEQIVQTLRFARPCDDSMLARLLPSLSYAEIEEMANQRRRLERKESDAARRSAHVRLRPDSSGLGSRISGFLPTEDAAMVRTALDRRAESVGPDPDTGVWEPHENRAAAALRDICGEDLARHAAGSSEPDASVVIVHVPESAVGHAEPGPGGSATIDGFPIHNDALHRILCDTRIEFHVDDPHGRTVGVGRAGRTPPRWLRRRATGRDHGRCRWPGCGRAIRHLHHMQHWSQGGATDASNLLGVCWHHHHLLHEGGWIATGDADHEVHLHSPTGRTLRSRPAPVAA